MRPSFFGMIGPNVKIATSLYSLFTSNGILQGVFLNDSTPVSHLIETERVHHHRQFGNDHIPWFPHPGVANTAVLSVDDKDYALFERDLPYELEISYPTVVTVGKVKAPFHSLSAHTTYTEPFIHSMTYSILHRTVSFLTLTKTFLPHRIQTVKTTYVPLVHDFLRHGDTHVFTESPIELSLRHFPAYLAKKPTYIHVVPDRYTSPESFFIFHYAQLFENETAYTLYAPAYDELFFNRVDISGKYRRFILDKATRTITVEKNPFLEAFNLDFPVKWGKYVLLRNLFRQKINGFILCDGLEVVRTYWVNVSVLGEPYIHEDTLYCFASDVHVYLLELDLVRGNQTLTLVELPGTLGFHSFMRFKYNKSNSNIGSS